MGAIAPELKDMGIKVVVDLNQKWFRSLQDLTPIGFKPQLSAIARELPFPDSNLYQKSSFFLLNSSVKKNHN
jgi:hypothetical protein